jgi:ATP-binding cassette, subfamily B, multidrug efflux pump
MNQRSHPPAGNPQQPGGFPQRNGGFPQQRVSFAPLWRAIRYLGHYRRIVVIAYICLFLSTTAQLLVPQMVQNIIDAITNGYIAQQVNAIPAAFQALALQRLGWTPDQLLANLNGAEQALIYAGLLIVLFAAASGIFSYGQSFNAERVSQSIAFDFRNDLYTKIQRLSFSYHDQNQTGQLMIRATDDVEKLRTFIGQGLLLAVQSIFMLLGALALLLLTNLQLMLVILPVLPVAFIIFLIFGRVTQPLFMLAQQKLARVNTVLQENLAGIKVVKAFAREPEQQARFGAAASDQMRQQIQISRVFSFLFPVVFLIANMGQAAILYFGGVQIVNGTLSFGEWSKFSLYLMYVFFPIGQLGFIISQMSQAAASAQRIYEILDAKSDVANKPGAIALPPIQGRVEFDHVTFRYFGGGDAALKNVSFSAEAGQTIALLGATGSGKSTIINLIPRFYDASEGVVCIDGHDIRDITLESLRTQIGIVLQDTTLFSGTIRDNIAFGKPDASLEAVIEAAKAASAHDFILTFPDGYNTKVGERGTTLSGGQKQRLAIARALLMDPRILILDDSTSSVDTVTEYQIQQALSRLMQGRTSFVIAQRISTVRNADQILVLDKGGIVAQGKHDDLMENSAIYAEIYSSQLVEDSTPEGEPVEG